MILPIKIAIVGGRDFRDNEYFQDVWDCYILRMVGRNQQITIVSGGCPTGADKMTKELALDNKRMYDYVEFPAEWGKYGKKAGPIRNQEIAEYSDIMVAFLGDKSKGTRNAISCMLRLKQPVFIFPY